MNSDSIIEVKNISMHFNMSKERLDSLKEYFIKLCKRDLRYEQFIALDNISFSVEKGTILGL